MPVPRIVEDVVRPYATSTNTPVPSIISPAITDLDVRDTQELPGTVIAGVAVLIALLSLLVGVLQFRDERQKRREAHELEHELMELEAEITEVM